MAGKSQTEGITKKSAMADDEVIHIKGLSPMTSHLPSTLQEQASAKQTVLEIKELEYEKKGKPTVSLYFKGKCVLTGQSCKTALVDSSSTSWNETISFMFVANKQNNTRQQRV